MDYYDTISGAYDELHKSEQMDKIRVIAGEISPKQDERLLNIGCGPFYSSSVFSCKKYGVDTSRELLKKAKDAKVFEASAQDLPFEDSYFDHVISITALHHAARLQKAISEIVRVSKSDGKIVLSILKKAKNYPKIKSEIEKKLHVIKKIDSDKDIIFVCRKL